MLCVSSQLLERSGSKGEVELFPPPATLSPEAESVRPHYRPRSHIASSSIEANVQFVTVMTVAKCLYRPRIETDLGRVADALRPSLHELSVWAETFRML
jgi:hypothetical protein